MNRIESACPFEPMTRANRCEPCCSANQVPPCVAAYLSGKVALPASNVVMIQERFAGMARRAA